MTLKFEDVYVGKQIKIKPTSQIFPNHKAVVAYIGTDGVSVYLSDSDFDECIPLDWDEIENP